MRLKLKNKITSSTPSMAVVFKLNLPLEVYLRATNKESPSSVIAIQPKLPISLGKSFFLCIKLFEMNCICSSLSMIYGKPIIEIVIIIRK